MDLRSYTPYWLLKSGLVKWSLGKGYRDICISLGLLVLSFLVAFFATGLILSESETGSFSPETLSSRSQVLIRSVLILRHAGTWQRDGKAGGW